MMSKLAIDGGTPVRTKPFPGCCDAAGRLYGREELAALKEVVETGHTGKWQGHFVKDFETESAAAFGVKHCVTATSGTTAIHTALGALNLEPGDEIITSPITDLGTIFPILFQLVIPVFADVDPATGNITAAEIEKQLSPKTKAIMPVHLSGQPCDMDPIMALARQHGLLVMEDCSQAHYSEYKGRLSGTLGDIGAFSMQASKQINAGEGGFLITNDDALGRRARLFADKGWPRDGAAAERDHLFLGPNYRMNEVTGALALCQLRKVSQNVAQRRRSAERLCELLAGIEGVIPPKVIEGANPAWWRFTFGIDHGIIQASQAEFAKALRAEGVSFGLGYLPHGVFEYRAIRDRITFGTSGYPWTLPEARKDIVYRREDYPNTTRYLSNHFGMSWCEGLTPEDAEDIARAIEKVADAYRTGSS